MISQAVREGATTLRNLENKCYDSGGERVREPFPKCIVLSNQSHEALTPPWHIDSVSSKWGDAIPVLALARRLMEE